MPDDTQPRIVVAKDNNALQISALNTAAANIGLETAQPLANVRAICPGIAVFDADVAADAQLLDQIVDWCDRFTPLVALDPPHGLFLDITGCAHLFGGEAAMLRTVRASLERQGFIVSAAIAATPACARALTRAARESLVTNGEEAEAVAPLPVFTLGADEAITRGLRRAGLKTIGDVAARTPHEITARFGAAFTATLQQALGRTDAPISPRRPLPDYSVEKRFAESVVTEDVIAATLCDLAQNLVASMDKHGKGARCLEARFFRTDGMVRTIVVETVQPVTKAAVMNRLFQERLDALADPLDPGFGFDLIRLSTSHVENVVQEQRDLDARTQDNDEVSALIDRIVARIGSQRVVVHLLQDTHIPEGAVLAAPAQHYLAEALRAEWSAHVEFEPPLRPLRLFEKPEAIRIVFAEVPDGPPKKFVWRRAAHTVVRAEGPERIAMEWWRSQNENSTRDYFRVEDDAGSRFWLYRNGFYGERVSDDGKPVQPEWFMHGLFA